MLLDTSLGILASSSAMMQMFATCLQRACGTETPGRGKTTAGGLLCPCWLDHMRACMFFNACMPVILLVLVQLVLDSLVHNRGQYATLQYESALHVVLLFKGFVLAALGSTGMVLCTSKVLVMLAYHSGCMQFPQLL